MDIYMHIKPKLIVIKSRQKLSYLHSMFVVSGMHIDNIERFMSPNILADKYMYIKSSLK